MRAGWQALPALRYSKTVYPRFQTGEAEALLAQIPAGLINGIGHDDREKPADSQELSLTVAGLAACRDTEMILTLFIRFILHVVAKERHSSIHRTYISRRDSPEDYQVSAAEFIEGKFFLSRLPGRRGKLLWQLHLILASEPALLVDISDYRSGYWVATFDRRIRYFRGIQNLDDYWARRFKPWEAPDEIPYPVVAGSNAPDQASRLQLLYDHPDLLADVLLGRIFDRCGGVTSGVSCPRVDPDIDSAIIGQGLRELEAQGRIRLRDVGTSHDLPDVILTSDGLGHISALRRDWADRVLRDRAARDALLGWLYDWRGNAGGAIDVDYFFGEPRSVHSGQFFSLSDIDGAARYLQEKNLIDVERISTRLTFLRITAGGIDRVEQGGDVAEYGKPVKPSVSYTITSFTAPVTAMNITTGGQANQHATGSSLDAGSLRTLIQAIVEALPGLGLDTQFLNQAKEAANEATAEIEQPQPDQPRLHVALRKVRDLLAQAGSQALAAVLSAAIDYELGKLGIPPAN